MIQITPAGMLNMTSVSQAQDHLHIYEKIIIDGL